MKYSFKRVTGMILAVTLSVSMAIPSFAATKEEVQSQIESLKSQQSELESQLADLKANKSDTESYIKELDSKIQDCLKSLSDINDQLAATEAEIEVTQENLDQAKKDEETQYIALKARIKAMYESGDESYVQMLLASDDLKSLLNNQEYISKINEYDQNLLTSLQEIRDKIAKYEAELEEQKEVQEAQKQEYEVEKESLEKVVSQKEEELVAIGANISDVSTDISTTQEELDAENSLLAEIVEQERKAAEEAARKAAEEAARKAAEEEARRQAAAAAAAAAEEEANSSSSENSSSSSSSDDSSSSGSDDSSTSGSDDSSTSSSDDYSSSSSDDSSDYSSSTSLSWPLSGGYISSSFGYRSSPTAGASSYHQGIDIAGVGSGASIYAAGSGTVITASYSSAMGNYVVISHGNGVNTIYEHCSALYVSAGQSVSRGETIAAVGSTGISTGAHLHFGVTVNGSYTNPLYYVSP